MAGTLKEESAKLIDSFSKVGNRDFNEIAKNHYTLFYDRFKKAADELNPYWKKYCELNNRLDYLPLGSKEYEEAEKECEAAKAEHDERQKEHMERLRSQFATLNIPLLSARREFPEFFDIVLRSRERGIHLVTNEIIQELQQLAEVVTSTPEEASPDDK